MRRSDSSIAACASGDCSRRPWSRSSAAIVCRLFFTRWWISRMVASFESSSRSRRRRSVTSRMSTQHADDLVALELRDRLHQQRRLAPLDLLGDREPGADGDVDRVLVEADLGEVQPRRVRVDAHAVQRADRVRAREPHAQVGVEEDHAVADARGVLELDLVLTEREAALGDHARRSGRTTTR